MAGVGQGEAWQVNGVDDLCEEAANESEYVRDVHDHDVADSLDDHMRTVGTVLCDLQVFFFQL